MTSQPETLNPTAVSAEAVIEAYAQALAEETSRRIVAQAHAATLTRQLENLQGSTKPDTDTKTE